MTKLMEGLEITDLPPVSLPCGYRVLVKHLKPIEQEHKSEGGIIMAVGNEAKRDQCTVKTGLVVAMGPECFHDKETNWYEVGDLVRFREHNGEMYEHENYNYQLMNDVDMLAWGPKEEKA